ncbi:MAG: HAD-IB family hydrolase [Flavobacteriales bacterium]|nr:HAD-IB family hydrolase [Flavobacteriales bacterium]MBP9159496.1 HAD-IB family hydrolase [Flavobacteriales bacterium]
MRTLALFDLDGTLTHGDTMLAFIRYRAGSLKYAWIMLQSGFLHVLGRIGLLPKGAGKRRLVRMAFAGASVAEVSREAEKFTQEKLPSMFRAGAVERVKWHMAEGHQTCIVTASCGPWVRHWCAAQGLELIATGMEEKAGIYTGELSTPNCKGEEKVHRLKETFDLREYASIHAYGDTPSDRPMLALATDPYYKPFNVQLSDADEDRDVDGANSAQPLPAWGFKAFAGLALALAAVGALLVHQAFKPITEAVAKGEFTRVREAFPRHGDWPDDIRFLPGHRVKLEDSDGTVRYEGPWQWVETETSLRLDDPAWDRRVLWVPGWGGPVLKVASPEGKDLFQTVTFKPLE